MVENVKYDVCDECIGCEAEKDEFFEFAEYVGSSYVEMWNSRYGGAFVDSDGNAVFVKRVMYKAPVVVVLWSDGTKSTAKCSEDDTFSIEAGLVIAIMNRLYGYDEMNRLFEDWLPDRYNKECKEDCTVDISEVRKFHKNIYKQVTELCKQDVITQMKEYLESCGYKVTGKR